MRLTYTRVSIPYVPIPARVSDKSGEPRDSEYHVILGIMRDSWALARILYTPIMYVYLQSIVKRSRVSNATDAFSAGHIVYMADPTTTSYRYHLRSLSFSFSEQCIYGCCTHSG